MLALGMLQIRYRIYIYRLLDEKHIINLKGSNVVVNSNRWGFIFFAFIEFLAINIIEKIHIFIVIIIIDSESRILFIDIINV